MSERETQIEGSLQQWRGVDQRTQPTLVQDGFFVMSRGVFFGLGDNAERVPGKVMSGKLAGPVFNIQQFGNRVLVQGMSELWIADVEELTDHDIIFQPLAPAVPTFSAVSFFSLDVTTPALPLYAISMRLERSPDNATWTIIASGLAGLQTVPESGLTDDTTYYYRAVAVGTGGLFTNGPSDNVTTPARLPDAPVAPTYTNITATDFDVIVSALPAFAVDMDLQRSADGISGWVTTNSGLTGGEIIPFTGETTDVPVYFRLIANNAHGSTNGAVSSVTPTTGTGDFRLTESGDFRITESGDSRIVE